MFLLQYGQAVGAECPLVVVAGEGGVHAVDGCLPFHGRAVHLRGNYRSSFITEYSLLGIASPITGSYILVVETHYSSTASLIFQCAVEPASDDIAIICIGYTTTMYR